MVKFAFANVKNFTNDQEMKFCSGPAGGSGTLRGVFNTLIKADIFGGLRRCQRNVCSDDRHDQGAPNYWCQPADLALPFLQADRFHVVLSKQQLVCRLTDKRVRVRHKIDAVLQGLENVNERRAVSKGFQMPKAARVREQSTITQKSRLLVPETPQNTPLHRVLGALQGMQINWLSRLRTAGCHTQHDTTIKGCDGGDRGLQTVAKRKPHRPIWGGRA